MSLLKYLTFILLIGSNSTFAETLCTFNDKPFDRDHADDLKGKTGMLKCKDKASDQTDEEQEYKDGKKIGHHLFRRDDLVVIQNFDEKGRRQGSTKWIRKGKLESEINYKDDDIVGLSREYWEDGKPKRISWIASDSWHSQSFSVDYNKNGKFRQVSCHSSSKPENEFGKKVCGWDGKPNRIELFDADGKQLKTMTFLNGAVVEKTAFSEKGNVLEHEVSSRDAKKIIENFPNGKVKMEAEYKNGSLNGIQNEYHESGKLIRQAKWKDGKMQSEEEFFLNGNRKTFSKLETNDQISRKVYSDNGQVIEEGTYQNSNKESQWGISISRWFHGTPVGDHKQYSESGTQLLSEHYSQDSKLEGEAKTFFENGKPEVLAVYKDGILKIRKKWNKEGKQVEDEEFFEDGSRKSRSGKN